MIKNLIHAIAPPVLLSAYHSVVGAIHKSTIHFEHNIPSWEEAERRSAGYDSDLIIQKVREGSSLVRDGIVPYERDGVIFTEVQYSWPLLASLLYASNKCNSLNVADFGGALGTTFFQNRRFLESLTVKVSWRVIEQEKFVRIGQKEFSNSILSFHKSLPSAGGDLDVILFGGSICYIEEPYACINLAMETGANYIIFDRTPITEEDIDTFAIQNVPPSIYAASYPIRNFSIKNIMNIFNNKYLLKEKWKCDLQPDPRTTAMGFLFEKY